VRSPRTPNQSLRLLLGQADWSGAALARAINAIGVERGLSLRYDRTAVGHWLAGTRPRPPVPELVAEALSRQLAKPVSALDTGLAVADPADAACGGAGDAAPPEPAAVDRLEQLAALLSLRGLAPGDVYSLAVLAVPQWSQQVTPPRPAPGVRPAAVGMAQVGAARTLLALLSQHDAAFGAGQVLVPLRQYLATAVVPWLRADAPPAVRRELLTVAGQLAYLCGFAHFDCNRNAEAQRYYLTGVGIAREAGDPIGYALGLRGLSVQAHALGHYAQADRLAEQAVETGLRHAPAQLQAFLLGQSAVTRASTGERRAATGRLLAAERCLERSTSGPTPVGAYHQGSLALQHAFVAKGLGAREEAIEALRSSLRHRPADECRSRAVSLAELAETQLSVGHLDQACHTWSAFLELYPRLHSARADDRLRAMSARLRPYRGNRAAAALCERAGRLGRGTR